MADNFTLLGLDTARGLEAAFEPIFYSQTPRRIETEFGAYLVYSDGAGAEFWLAVDDTETIFAANGFFDCGAGIAMEIETFGLSDDLHGRAESTPQVALFENGALASKTIAYAVNLASTGPVPRRITGGLCVLSYDTTVHATETEFDAAQDGGLRMAPQSYLPTGMFGTDGPAAPHGMGNGPVRASGLAAGLGGCAYAWARVGGIGGDFGITWEPDTCPVPEPGAILSYAGVAMVRDNALPARVATNH